MEKNFRSKASVCSIDNASNKMCQKAIRFFMSYIRIPLIMNLFCWKIIRFRGGSRIFSREADFQKVPKILSTCLLDRPNWFSKLSQRTTKTLFWPKFLRRRQNFEKTGRKKRFRHFWKTFTKKKHIFSARAPPLQLV